MRRKVVAETWKRRRSGLRLLPAVRAAASRPVRTPRPVHAPASGTPGEPSGR